MLIPEWFGVAGIISAIAVIIYLAMKGYSIVFIGPLAAIIVILTNNMDLYAGVISGPKSYMMSLTQYIVNYFAIFLLGSVMARYLEVSGASTTIAKTVMKITGTEKPFSLLVAVLLICAVMTYGGISLFVVLFAVIPLARPIFIKMDMAWNLIVIPVLLGTATFTMSMLPGTPSIQNVIPTTTLGTTLTAAPISGLVATAATVAFGLWYMNYELKKSIKKGENYGTYVSKSKNASTFSTPEDAKLPPIGISILPLVVLILIILAGSILKIPNVILIGMIVANIVSAICFHSYVKGHRNVINTGAQGAVIPVFLTAAAVGFGGVITTAPGFKSITQAIFNLPGGPLVSLSTATILMSVITGSASGSTAIIMSAFAKDFVAMGLHPDAIHRLTVVASGIMGIMPHSGFLLSLLALTDLNHRTGFKYAFISVMGASSIGFAVVFLFSMLGIR